jgi:ATP synthase protein I
MSRPPGDSGADARGLALISTAVAQLVVPTLVGVWLDDRNGWSPWGAMAGVLIGFVTMVAWMSRKQDRNGGTPPSDN